MRSDKPRHFPQTDPVPRNYQPEKVQAREEIDRAMAEFLSNGGQIQEVGSEANRNPQFIIGNVIRPR
jgi:hypothetical protein